VILVYKTPISEENYTLCNGSISIIL